jgi:hypothetical protein
MKAFMGESPIYNKFGIFHDFPLPCLITGGSTEFTAENHRADISGSKAHRHGHLPRFDHARLVWVSFVSCSTSTRTSVKKQQT